ncbi:Atu4866 domain-containing protein [Nocardioides sp. TF02-7]|uniref:Atu4866 domain-containing protein n=1 Tax=Nocardioides sp. TF02-7 TaxID=2917724 RepID=UPI001F051963|nr:Atu4866 domain-containing protein [Nocardioides sp. TF02-7]UMG93962.1 Atu4866 domain-containing protein [Nocardioides sp. TF02-7]
MTADELLRRAGPGAVVVDLGGPETFAVVRGLRASYGDPIGLVVRPPDLAAVVLRGEVVARDGRARRDPGPGDEAGTARAVGAWHDDGHALVQHLLPDGRYTETRSGRADAYTGRYWVAGDQVVYLDDSGFWAFGRWEGDLLHHASFVMDRRPPADGQSSG